MSNEGQPEATTEQERSTTADAGWLRLFGEPYLCWHGQRYPVARRQTQALFYYLALHRQPVTRGESVLRNAYGFTNRMVNSTAPYCDFPCLLLFGTHQPALSRSVTG